MIKRKDNLITYILSKDDKDYQIILRHLRNTPAGCPRYEAFITEPYHHSSSCLLLTYVYTFTGHYLSERDEASMILDYHLEKMAEE